MTSPTSTVVRTTPTSATNAIAKSVRRHAPVAPHLGTSIRLSEAAITIAPRTALGRSANSGARKTAVARTRPAVTSDDSCDFAPAASAVAVWDRLDVGGEAAEQAGGDVRRAQRQQLLVGVERVAVAGRERARRPRPTRRPRGTRSRSRPRGAAGSRTAAAPGGPATAARSRRRPRRPRRGLRGRAAARRRGRSRARSAARGSAARSAAGPGSPPASPARSPACTGSVSGSDATSWRSWSGTDPEPDGTPSSLGSWPTTIVIDEPEDEPGDDRLGEEVGDEPEPRDARRRPAAGRRSARAPRSARGTGAGSPPARSTTTAADMIAIVELAVTLTWRLVPNTA